MPKRRNGLHTEINIQSLSIDTFKANFHGWSPPSTGAAPADGTRRERESFGEAGDRPGGGGGKRERRTTGEECFVSIKRHEILITTQKSFNDLSNKYFDKFDLKYKIHKIRRKSYSAV